MGSLTLPPGGWRLATHCKVAPQAHVSAFHYADRTYTDNQDPTKKSDELTHLKEDVEVTSIDIDGEAAFTAIGQTD